MDRTAISDQIDRILRSQSFASKDQLRKLLDVLFKNMDAQTTLKPDRVIKELWPDEIRTKRSADVATEMNRLRHALESYYDGQGRADPIIISLPNRSGVGPDGLQETRWIAAEPRGALESASALLAPLANRRRDLKIVVATVAACVAAYFLIRLVTADNRPHSGRMDGAALTIVNAEGKELWAKSFPEGFWREYYEPGLAPRIRFADLDGSGHTDVLFLYHPAVSPTSRTTTLICYSDRGKEKWRWTPGRDLPELQGTPSNYRTYGLEFLEGAEGKGARRIVVASGHTLYYPYQIAILNSNGKTISEYWHSGGLNHFVVANLNGKPQIFAAGSATGIVRRRWWCSILTRFMELPPSWPGRRFNFMGSERQRRGFVCYFHAAIWGRRFHPTTTPGKLLSPMAGFECRFRNAFISKQDAKLGMNSTRTFICFRSKSTISFAALITSST